MISQGYVRAGDTVLYEPHPGDKVTVRELFRDFFAPRRDEATIRRHLASPIAIRDRVAKEQQLHDLAAQGAR